MAAVPICSDFGAAQNKVEHCFQCFSICHEVMGPDAMILVFPGGLDGKASAYNAGDPGSIPALGGSPGEGNGNPLQCSCLENPRGGGAWWAAIYGVTQSRLDTTEAN